MIKYILRLQLFFLFTCFNGLIYAQTAPYALSPIWVFGNKGQFNFTSGSLVQNARTDNIIANEGSSTICLPNKTILAYDDNVRVAGNDHSPLGAPYLNSSSSGTQGGLILNDPSVAAGTSFFWITGNSEATYPTQEPNDVAEQGLRAYKGSQSGTSVTSPSLVSTLTTNTSSFPWESLYASSDGNYGYYILSGGANSGSNGQVMLNTWNLSAAGSVGGINTQSYNSSNYNPQAQASVKVNRCQTKIAIVNGGRLAVFNWNYTSGTLGTVIKDMPITISGGGKLYGVEFSLNSNYVFVTTLNGDKLSVVDLTTGSTTNGETLINGTWSGSLQMGPDGIIYVANGQDAVSVTSIGTIVNPNAGPGATFNAAGLSLANSSSVRLGMTNIPWLNPQKPTATIVNNSCGSYTFTPVFETHYNDAVTYNKAVWDFGDGSALVTNSGASATNPVTHVYTTGSTGNKTITLTLTDNTCIQDWTGTVVQNVPCILPIELVSFKASVKDNGVLLNWQTATELNNDYFEIQRSLDGVHFETIGRQNGAGNSSSLLTYSYLDNLTNAKLLYYRLVQHDFDGVSTESNIIAVQLDKNAAPIVVMPNPFHSSFMITKLVDEKATIQICDIYGRVLETRTSTVGETALSLGESLIQGYYIVQYNSGSSSYTVRVEKQ